ncbi:MAG TPA: M50 family metallopeptidase [Syntrophomonadaceae bacterium]|nr:M50 family metallopeptidase [Syntrophomonadaceae bacterium]
MKLGSIAGVKLKLNPLFLLLLVLYGCLGLIEEVFVIVASLLLHEIAHTVLAFILRVKIAEIELMPFGGQAKIEDFTGLDPEQEIYVALAGPLISLSLAAAFYFWPASNAAVSIFVTFNFFLGCFNLIPALPLDGGRIARALLSTRIGYRKATLRIALSGKIMAFGLVAWGSYQTYLQHNSANYVIIGLFLFWAANREGKLLAYSFMRYLINKKSELSKQGFLPSQQIVVKPETMVKKVLHRTRPTYYIIVVIISEKHEIIGVKTEAELIECLFEKGPRARMSDCEPFL